MHKLDAELTSVRKENKDIRFSNQVRDRNIVQLNGKVEILEKGKKVIKEELDRVKGELLVAGRASL